MATCPMKGTSGSRRRIFVRFSRRSRTVQRLRNAWRFASWSSIACSSVSPKTHYNEIISNHLNSPEAFNNFIWNTSGADDIPKGRRFHLYRSKGELKVVSLDESSSKGMCQNPCRASRIVKHFAP